MRYVYRHWLFKLPLLRHYQAICLGRTVFFKAGENEITPRLLRHEQVHQEQIARLGLWKFYSLYLGWYLRNLARYRNHWLAYRNIPLEREAFEREDRSV